MFETKRRISTPPKSMSKRMSDSDELEEDQYIFYNQSKKVTATKIELEARLNSDEKTKVKILIDVKSTIQFLSLKIADFMENFPIYSNLEGLKAVNMTKKTEKGVVKLPNDDIFEVKDYLESGNIIYCDLQTEEYWVNSKINLLATNRELSTSLEIKLKVKLKIKELKAILVKKALNFWSDYPKNDNLYYVFIDATCYTQNSKNNISFRIENLGITDELDETEISEIFGFKSQLVVDFRLISIEEIIFNELIENAKSIKEKYGEFINTYFYEFITLEKFNEEFKTVKKLARKFIKSQISSSKNRDVYTYNKLNFSKTQTTEDLTELKYHSVVIIPLSDHAKYENLNKNEEDPFSQERRLFETEPKARSIDNYNEAKSIMAKSKESAENITSNYSLNLKESLLNDEVKGIKKKEKMVTYLAEDQNPEKIKNFRKSGFFLNSKNRQKSNKSLSLCSEIVELIKIDKIGELVNSVSKIRVCAGIMDNVEIPQFRNFKSNPERRSFIKSESHVSRKSSFIENNFHKRTFCFIGGLIVVFIVVVVLILKFFN